MPERSLERRVGTAVAEMGVHGGGPGTPRAGQAAFLSIRESSQDVLTPRRQDGSLHWKEFQ